jgi:hypothetical protein
LFLDSNLEKAQFELNKLIGEQDEKMEKLQEQIDGIINDDILVENLKIQKFRLEYISNKLKIQVTQEYIQKYKNRRELRLL